MKAPRFLQKPEWTPLEVAVWFVTLFAATAGVISVFTDAIGSWALGVGSGMLVALSLIRYRAAARRANQNTGHQENE